MIGDRVAKWISIVTTAPILSVVPFILLNRAADSNEWLVLSSVTVGFALLLPISVTLLWSKTTRSRGWDIPERRDRIVPLAIGSASYLAGAWVLTRTGGPEISVLLMFCYGTNTLVVLVISLWWKVSVHAMGVMGPTVALLLAFGPIGAMMGLILPVVMWARVCLNKHTMAQVIAGASLGVVLTYGQFMLLATQTEFASDITAMAAVAYALIAPSLVLGLAGWMNRLGVRDGLTRKFFHFVGFGSLAFYSNSLSQELLFLFLASGVVYVTVACLAHEGSLWYEGVRRKSDRPLDRLYVVLPMISMVMAIGLTTALLPPTAVLIGMLCVAIGDAVAEPVGSLIGRHPYSVFALVGHKSVRTFEGSIAVAVCTGLVFGLLTSGWVWALLFGVVLAGVEAISPRGTDNFTVFVAASSLSLWLPV